jgi:hypothetical protein
MKPIVFVGADSDIAIEVVKKVKKEFPLVEVIETSRRNFKRQNSKFYLDLSNGTGLSR